MGKEIFPLYPSHHSPCHSRFIRYITSVTGHFLC